MSQGQRSRYTKSHSPLLHGERLASRDPGGEQRMKNERCTEFWWDEGTAALQQRSSQHALRRLITKGREVCEAFDYMSQQRPLGVLLVGWHHLHSSDLASALMNKQRVRILLSTRGCSSRKTNDMNICAAEFWSCAASELRRPRWHWLHVATRQQNVIEHVWVSQRNLCRPEWKLTLKVSSIRPCSPRRGCMKGILSS